MSRNFGIMSGRSALGGTSDRPSATRDAIHPRDSNNVIYLPAARPSLRQPDSRADDFEVGAGFFFLSAVLLPWVVVGGLTIGYLLFVS